MGLDNPTTVAVQILSGGERRVNPRHLALACHFSVEPLFRMPPRGNEKPRAGDRGQWSKPEWATPVTQVHGLDELNVALKEIPAGSTTNGDRTESTDLCSRVIVSVKPGSDKSRGLANGACLGIDRDFPSSTAFSKTVRLRRPVP